MVSRISVVIVSYNSAELLSEMFSALYGSLVEFDLHVVVVDNNSSDGSADFIRANRPEICLIRNIANVGFGRANNQAASMISGRFVLLLNTDAFVSPGTLSKTVDYMEKTPECGVLGVRLTGRDGELQPSCRYFPTPLNVFLSRAGLSRFFPWIRPVDDMNWDHASVRECDWVPGCYYLIRREVIDKIGLFDPRYFLYYEEVDHCKRVKEAGWKVVYYPHTSVVHLGGESAKSAGEITASGRQLSALQIESELLYFRKHHGWGGLALHMVLVTVGDLLLALKALLKGRGLAAIAACWQHARITWGLLFDTHFATRPTR